MDVPRIVPLKEASRLTGLSYRFLREGCLRHEIVHVRAGNKFYINLGKLVEKLNTQK